jgi:hypothetical protein
LMLRTLFETPVPVATVSGSVRLKMAFTAPRISNFWSISELSIRSRERVICGGRKFAPFLSFFRPTFSIRFPLRKIKKVGCDPI